LMYLTIDAPRKIYNLCD